MLIVGHSLLVKCIETIIQSPIASTDLTSHLQKSIMAERIYDGKSMKIFRFFSTFIVGIVSE